VATRSNIDDLKYGAKIQLIWTLILFSTELIAEGKKIFRTRFQGEMDHASSLHNPHIW
jgi:hypothetical protein